jgi:DNA polymerase-1
MTQDPRLLIDADGILYKSVAAAEYEADWGDGIFVASTNINQAKDMFLSQIEALKRELGNGQIVMVLSGRGNFRKDLDPSYKSNRVSRKPLGFVAMTEWLSDTFTDVVSQDGIEADDYLGILATKPGSPDSIIVSDDKDLKTIPGKLFRLGELSTIDDDEAERYWLLQALTGDTADGYKGCPGVGTVKAEKTLLKPGSRWENVKREFLKAGLTEDYAVLQARLARILRYEDWDSVNKCPRLWTPPPVSTPSPTKT